MVLDGLPYGRCCSRLEFGAIVPLSDHPRRFLGPLGLDSGRTITPFRKNSYWKEKDNPNKSSWKKIWFGLSLSGARGLTAFFQKTSNTNGFRQAPQQYLLYFTVNTGLFQGVSIAEAPYFYARNRISGGHHYTQKIKLQMNQLLIHSFLRKRRTDRKTDRK